MNGPVNTLVSRISTQDIMLNDLLIPKNTVVNIEHEYNHYS